MLVIGVTGGIGSGKTAATDRFQEHGITVVDADLASRVIVEPGRPALQAIGIGWGYYLFNAIPYVLTLAVMVITCRPDRNLSGAPGELSLNR